MPDIRKSLSQSVSGVKIEPRRWFFPLYIAFLTFLSTSAFYFLFIGDNQAITGGSGAQNPAYVLLWLIFYGITTVLFLGTVLKHGLDISFSLVVLLILFTISSITWSFDAKRTAFYGIMFSMMPLAGYVVALNVQPQRFLRLSLYIFTFFIASSLILFFFVPGYTATQRWGGGFTNIELAGVFSHKSDAGYYTASLIIMFLFATSLGLKMSMTVRVSLIAMCLLMIFLSNSATSLGALVIMTGIIFFLYPLSRLRHMIMTMFGLFLVALALAVPYIKPGQIAVLFGRDPNLTGRDDIWNLGQEFIMQSPVLGYGYYGFFSSDAFSPLWKLWEKFDYFLTPHFHNSSMDIMISLGIVGYFFYLIICFFAIMIIWNQTIPEPVRMALTTILFIFFISSAFDFTFFKHNHYTTFFLFYLYFAAQQKYNPG